MASISIISQGAKLELYCDDCGNSVEISGTTIEDGDYVMCSVCKVWYEVSIKKMEEE